MYLIISKNENYLLILEITDLLMTSLCLLFVGKHLNIWLQHGGPRLQFNLQMGSSFGEQICVNKNKMSCSVTFGSSQMATLKDLKGQRSSALL